MRTTHSAIAHAAGRLTVPIEIRPDIGAALAAGVADKPRLQIGQADVIRPRVGAELLPMRAAQVGWKNAPVFWLHARGADKTGSTKFNPAGHARPFPFDVSSRSLGG